MATIGLIIILGGYVSYLALLFVIHGFTYRTWIFDAVIVLGIVVTMASWAMDADHVTTSIALALGLAWFPVTRHELRLNGSERLNLGLGDRIPKMSLLTTDGRKFTEQDLIANAPALLLFYRGWWCPSSKTQLDEIIREYESLSQAGLTIFAASVDHPVEAEPLQKRVGGKITILCNFPASLLDEVGVCDKRGAPWYDQILFGAKKQDIAMPSALVIGRSGEVLYAYRSTRVDDRPQPEMILAGL